MNDKEISLLKHSLGLSHKSKPYRNYYATDIEDSDSQDTIDSLIEKGYMRLGHTSQYLNYYWVTNEGRIALAKVTGMDTSKTD